MRLLLISVALLAIATMPAKPIDRSQMPNAQNSLLPLLLRAAPAARWNGDGMIRGFKWSRTLCATMAGSTSLKFDADFVFRGQEG